MRWSSVYSTNNISWFSFIELGTGGLSNLLKIVWHAIQARGTGIRVSTDAGWNQINGRGPTGTFFFVSARAIIRYVYRSNLTHGKLQDLEKSRYSLDQMIHDAKVWLAWFSCCLTGGMVPVHVCKAFRVKARSLHAQDLAIVCHTAHQQWSIKKSCCGLIKNIRSAQLPQRIEIWLMCWVNSTNASVKMSREYQTMKNKNSGGSHWRMQLTESRNSSLAVKFHTI